VENNGKVVGSAGVAQNEAATICELQKIFLPETRGLGIGGQVMAVCLQSAKLWFENCYLETMPFMHDIKYKSGFEYINAPMGSTGHVSCQFGC
jgi:putative acetyltransferase